MLRTVFMVAALAGAASAQPAVANQFDLVCRGQLTTTDSSVPSVFPEPGGKKPWEGRFILDLSKAQLASANAKAAVAMAYLEPNEIGVRNVTYDERHVFEKLVFSRETGRFAGAGYNPKEMRSVFLEGECTKAEFSGLPTTAF